MLEHWNIMPGLGPSQFCQRVNTYCSLEDIPIAKERNTDQQDPGKPCIDLTVELKELQPAVPLQSTCLSHPFRHLHSAADAASLNRGSRPHHTIQQSAPGKHAERHRCRRQRHGESAESSAALACSASVHALLDDKAHQWCATLLQVFACHV